jgi:hypothetical protein
MFEGPLWGWEAPSGNPTHFFQRFYENCQAEATTINSV